MFEDDGLIPSTNGDYIELEDFFKKFAQIGYLNLRTMVLK